MSNVQYYSLWGKGGCGFNLEVLYSIPNMLTIFIKKIFGGTYLSKSLFLRGKSYYRNSSKWNRLSGLIMPMSGG